MSAYCSVFGFPARCIIPYIQYRHIGRWAAASIRHFVNHLPYPNRRRSELGPNSNYLTVTCHVSTMTHIITYIMPDHNWSIMIKYVIYDQVWSTLSLMLYLSTLSKLRQHCQCWKRWHNCQWWSDMIKYDQLWSVMIALITLCVPFRAALIFDKAWSVTDQRWSGFRQMSTFK